MNEPYFGTEPVSYCPNCGAQWHAEWVDIGFGPYSQQAGPHYCTVCDTVEKGCPSHRCIGNKCISYSFCLGRAI